MDFDFLSLLMGLVNLAGPVLVALLVVPLYQLLKKRVLPWLDSLPAPVQRLAVLLVAALLTWLGTMLNVVLPTDLAFFAEADVSALLSAALAWCLHAWGKAKEG